MAGLVAMLSLSLRACSILSHKISRLCAIRRKAQSKNQYPLACGLAQSIGFAHCSEINGTKLMQRKRAIAIAMSKTQERNRVLTIAAGMLLLPAALLLLLISP